MRLAGVLRGSPGLSARELSAALRREGVAVQKHDINPVLYHDARLENDGGRVPRWRLAGAAASAPFTRDEVAARRRARRDQLDQRQRVVASLRSGGDVRASSDDELLQALALLRSKGYDVALPARAPHERGIAPRALVAPPAEHEPRAESPRRGSEALTLPDRWGIALRGWQAEALAQWFSAGGTGVCEAVTGTGKTHLGLEAVYQWIERGERATILVPSILLQRQWEQRLQQFVPHAVIAKVGGEASGDPVHADVIVAVVHSALRQDLSDVGRDMTLLVADEVHRYGGEGWAHALRQGYTHRLGLTATLERGSDDGVESTLLPYFGTVVHHYGFDRATVERVVAPFDLVFLGIDLEADERVSYEELSRKLSQARKRLLAAGANPTRLHQQLGQLRAVGGEVTQAVIAYESASRDRRRLLSDAAGKVDALELLAEAVGESHGSVIFTQSKETADAAADALEQRDVRAAAIYSEGMTPQQRQRLIDALGDGELDALAAPRILDEGVDIPDVDLGVVLGASSSRRQMIQRLGRVIRLKADGRRARFVVLYATDSVEDPESGARDDFMSEVETAANKVVLFREWDDETLDRIWSGAAPAWDREQPPSAPLPDSLHVRRDVPAPTAAAVAESRIQQEGNTDRPATQSASAFQPVRARRVSRPLPPVAPAPVTDPLLLADLLAEIDETAALVAWIRSEQLIEAGHDGAS